MAGGQSVWGIDLGKCALKALKLRPGLEGQLEVVAQDYIEHAKILSQPDADRDTLIANALEKFLSRNDITGDRVVVSVPGQHTLARFSKLPPVDAKKIPDLVRYEADQQIPFDMDEVVWDYQTFQEPDTPEIEVGIFAMKRALVRDYLLHFEQAGIEPILVQSAPLALYNAVYFDELLGDDTTVLVDIGAENTDLVVADKFHLWTRTIPLGGNNFTDALVKSFKLSFPNAEKLKRTAATSKYARDIFKTLRPTFADLVQELQRSIGFYTSTHRDAKLGRVIGLGNAFQLPGLEKYIEQNLQLPIVRPEAFKMLSTAGLATAEQFKQQLPSFGVAYGLCVQGLDLSQISTSLLPSEIARQIVWSKKNPYFIAAAACLALAAGTIWFRAGSDQSALKANAGAVARSVTDENEAQNIISQGPGTMPPREYANVVLNAAQALRQHFNDAAGKGQEEDNKINRILGLLDDRGVLIKLFDVIHNSLPAPPALRDVKSGTEYAEAIKATPKLARDQREEVFIESFRTEYHTALESEELTDKVDIRADLKPVAAVAGSANTGYLVRLRCRTPYKATAGENVLFMQQQFIEPLRQNGRQPKQGFYINRIVIDSKAPVGSAPAETGSPPPTAGSRGMPGGAPIRGGAPGGRGMVGGRGMPGGPSPGRGGEPAEPSGGGGDAPALATGKDPLTGEDIKNDWVFNIIVEVVLADLPEPPPSPEGAQAAAQSGASPQG